MSIINILLDPLQKSAQNLKLFRPSKPIFSIKFSSDCSLWCLVPFGGSWVIKYACNNLFCLIFSSFYNNYFWTRWKLWNTSDYYCWMLFYWTQFAKVCLELAKCAKSCICKIFLAFNRPTSIRKQQNWVWIGFKGQNCLF